MTRSDLPPASIRSVTLPPGKVAALRRRKLLTQAQLVQACLQQRLYVSIATLKRAEGGRSVSLRTAIDLARFFGVSVPELMAPEAPPGTAPSAWSENHTVPLLWIWWPGPAMPDGRPVLEPLRAERLHSGDDALLYAFGLDEQAGDAPFYAVQAAMRLLAMAWPGSLQPSFRVTFGEVTISRDGVALARPTAVPPQPVAGQIRICASIRELLGDVFMLAPAEDAHEWAVLGNMPSALPSAPALAGRHAEMQRLRASLDACRQGHSASLMLLRAGIGMGKSRLAGECVTWALAMGFECHVLHARQRVPGQGAALLERLIVQVAGNGRSLPDLSRYGLGLAHEAWLLQLLGQPLGPVLRGVLAATAPGSGEQLQAELLRELLRWRAASMPQLLVIDDGHDAGEALWQTLIAVLGELQAQPVLLLTTVRSASVPARELGPQAADACVPCITLDLAPLPRPAALQLAEALGHAAAPHLQACLDRAAGNPLFLTCLLAHPEAGEALPASLRAAVNAEVLRLSAGERHALGVAAVAGEQCSAALLAELAGTPLSGSGSGPLLIARAGDQWRFTSALVRDLVYQQLQPAARAELHLRIAQWYRDRDPAARARHLAFAGSPQAVPALLDAACAEAEALRDTAALALLEMARALPHGPAHAGRLHGLSGELQLRRGRPALALVHLRRAAELGGSQCAWTAQLAAAEALLQLDRIDEALALLQTLEQRGGATPAALAQLYYLRGRASFPRNEVARSMAAQSLALDHACRAGDKVLQARAYSGLADADYAQGEFGRARQQYEACLALCGEHELLPIQAANRAALGSVLLYLGEVAASLEETLFSIDIARRIGLARAEAFSCLAAGWVLLEMDEADSAAQYLGQGLQVAQAAGLSRFLPLFLEGQARVALELGAPAEAVLLASQAQAAVIEGGLQAYVGPWVAATQAACSPPLVRAPLVQAALAGLSDAMFHNHLQLHTRLLHLALGEGTWAAVAGHARALAGDARSRCLPWAQPYLLLTGIDAPDCDVADACATARALAARHGYLALARRLGAAAGAVRP
ncbi:AAA family ATPase [Chitiniphilus purpureus]|uniref:AAA family ATPase n=1 Tax=Chitiniphilus purpureus TaxID=2981137 RepID=A0ABY6DME9_9NEIS|nr:AAA family ATPase [Chitiniphilus sp. CD1]UXY15529.1 AAA family ATPase [Chitiniphilus sp. CD1]